MLFVQTENPFLIWEKCINIQNIMQYKNIGFNIKMEYDLKNIERI